MTSHPFAPGRPVASSPSPGSRIDWIDFAKASAIILVVLFHATDWFAATLIPGIGGTAYGIWREISVALIPVRIPLFFLVSGVLAAAAVHRPWRTLLTTRVPAVIWPFLIWTILISVPWLLRIAYGNPAESAWLVSSALIFGGAHFWYLPALAAFILIARAVRRVPRTAVIVSALVALVAPLLSPMVAGLGPVLGQNVVRWPTFLFWFVLGCFARRAMLRFAELPWLIAIVGVAMFVGLRWVLVHQGVFFGLVAMLSVTGVLTGVLLSRLAVRAAPLARLGRYLAARTLPIYVGHALLLEVAAVVVQWARRRGVALPADVSILNAMIVPVIVVSVVLGALGMYAAARRLRMGWLYEPPPRLFGRAPAAF